MSRPGLPWRNSSAASSLSRTRSTDSSKSWRTEATGRQLADPITHRCARRPSGRPAQSAAVLHHLVRPRASLRARLAEPQPRRVPCRRPRAVTHMMPGIWVVSVHVTPFPAAICPGELRTAEHAGFLACVAECYGERIVCHLRDPLRCCWPCGAWRRGGGGSGSGMQSQRQPTPRRQKWGFAFGNVFRVWVRPAGRWAGSCGWGRG
jgi:hypothetical protein